MIDKSNPIPLYYQIKNDIFNDIESGVYRPGERLPGERFLAEKYGVTRMTIRQALKVLVDQEYLQARHGSGTFVSERSPVPSTGENKTIGLLVPDIQRGIMVDLIRGIEDEAHQGGFNIILCNTDNLWDKAHGYVDRLLSNNVNGVIYIPIQDIEDSERKERKNKEIIERFTENDTPIVLVDHGIKAASTDLVISDNFGGGYELTQHLIQMGHQRIAVVYDFEENSVLDRLSGYKRALQDNNIDFDPNFIQNIKDSGFTESFSELIKHIFEEIKATAIFAMNDLLAADIYYHAEKLKLDIPQQISVVGYDDLPFSERLRTPLTTIHQPLYQMGRESYSLLMERIQNPKELCRKVVLPNRLVMRKSVKKISKD